MFFNLGGLAHEHDPLAFFGCLCLCTGYLIYSLTFMPRLLGVAHDRVERLDARAAGLGTGGPDLLTDLAAMDYSALLDA